ncbi:uncharacterized protein LOC132261022 [Phlebotomus argentipes]|uniref:uncharacterized protein LOC132261022 n=1 Tax=Phlebotomus argentipes TaxID=94469 RepID=UPI002892E382|nr:uncharacterized protein LOC132261022 [Phlebotomus argentipes]
MKSFQIATFLVIVATVAGRPRPKAQTTVDPAYLRQYYAHLAQANQAGESSGDATPIYEPSNQDVSPHYSHPSQAPKTAYVSPTVRQYHQQQSQPQQQQLHYVSSPQSGGYKSSGKTSHHRPSYQDEEPEDHDVSIRRRSLPARLA